ncbi:MAG: hypothetical protein HFH53_03575 [Hespellia sp.]|nr:hypothetical protein [Hespellia sp.]
MRAELAFLLLLIVNLLVAVLYVFWNTVIVVSIQERRKRKRLVENRRTYWLRFAIMILCPVAGPLFFLCSFLLVKLPIWKKADLSDVVFSKVRARTQLKADEERERNMIPLEEAISVNDKTNLRQAMLNVLKGDVKSSLSAISQALNVKDQETSHYAASVLSDELNEFRINVQKMYREIQKEPAHTEYGEQLIDYTTQVLAQHVFSEIEQRRFIHMLEESADLLYENNRNCLTETRCETICLLFLEEKDFEGAYKWCQRLTELYPEGLAVYTCKLKLYFTMKKKEDFFETLESLKKSDIVIDYETLELIRLFG